jgi:RNA polymerase-associated protein
MLRKPNPSETVLYSAPNSLESHAIRFIASEKDLECDVMHTEFEDMPEELIAYNPTETMPTLFDRELILYDMAVIMEYLDERFPFPPMLPIDPIDKAEKRTLIYRFTRAKDNWYQLVDDVLNGTKKVADNSRKF